MTLSTIELVKQRYPNMNLGAFTRNTSLKVGDKLAIIDLTISPARVLTYAELEQSICKAVGAFREMGCTRGTRVALGLPNSASFLVAFLALLRLGSIPVLLNYKLSADTLAFVLKDSGAEGVLAEPARMPTLKDAAAACELSFRFAVGDDPDGWGLWDRHLEKAVATDDVEVMGFDDQAFQPYTAGSTGVPKGVVLTHGGMLWGIEHSERYWPRSEKERAIVAAPMFHKNAMRGTIKPCLRSGASVVIMEEFRPRGFLKAVAEHQVTSCGGVPAMFSAILKEEDLINTLDLSDLSLISMGSSTVADELITRLKSAFSGVVIKEGYGLTEGGAPLRAPLDSSKTPRGSVGRPAPEYEVRLRDANGRISQTVGELEVRSPYVLKEYANRPDLTRERLVKGWLKTGDLFRIDPEGFYYFIGRNDDMFVCGGENVYPKEVESMILKHPGVADAVVVPVPHATKGEAPAVLVVPRNKERIEPRDIQNYCAEHGPTFLIPRVVALIEKIPLTAAEKPDRVAVKTILMEQL